MENNIVSYRWEDGILCGKFETIQLNKDNAAKAIDLRLKLCNGQPHLFMMDVTNIKVIDAESRNLLSSEIGTRHLTACAIVSKSAISSMLANFFIKINKPKTPTRFFTDASSAKKWLFSFR